MNKKPVIVEVSGGCVTAVWNCDEWELLDWDNLLDRDSYTRGDAAEAWANLSPWLQEEVKKNYPDDYAEIQKRIREDEERNGV